jgi:hypothetical protein
MTFVPAGFGDLGGDLLVSVSGSNAGGGELGAVYAMNSSGQIVAALIVGSQFAAFDPRGLYFPNSSTLLISDAADPILAASPVAFAAVPEPSSIVLIGTGLAVLVGMQLRRVFTKK